MYDAINEEIEANKLWLKEGCIRIYGEGKEAEKCYSGNKIF
jgi:hypothetical protein